MSTVDSVPLVALQGASGQSYQAGVYPWTTQWYDVAGVYVVLRDEGTRYVVLYVGETANLRERLGNHHRQLSFDRNRRTHLAWIQEPNAIKRALIERDLMGFYKPCCNLEV